MTMDQGVLAGLKVIEVSRHMSAAVSAMQLAEAGAQVTRIVAPGAEDPAASDPGFAVWHRSKETLALDLGPTARTSLDKLLAAADVLIHDLGPKAAAELGLDDARLTAAFPRLVIGAIPTWPAGHPKADDPHRETLVMARLGILDEQRAHRPGPIFVRMPVGAWCAAWLSVLGVMARLVHRQSSGRGGAAHTSLAQGSLTTLIQLWARASEPSDSFKLGMPKTLHWSIFQCSDGGWIHVIGTPDHVPAMRAAMDALGPEGVAQANGRWPNFGGRFPNGGANAEIFRTRPARVWLEDLWAHDVPAQFCAPLGDVYFDEQARLNGYVVERQDPIFGPTLQPGIPIEIEPPNRIRAPGQATAAAEAAVHAAPFAPAEKAGGPLAGLKVLDFGSFMAGPFGPQCMSELGAEVIKVEAVTGDPKRIIHRNFAGSCRGKRSVALDLRDPRSRPALEAMVRWADVVHHNVRAEAAQRLGIDYESLKAIKPELVYCHVTAYGPKGPRTTWPGYDQVFQSFIGWETAGGGEGNSPIWYRFGMMDVFCAMSSTFATLLALYHRNRTGKGQAVAASLLGASALTAGESVGRPDGSVIPYAQLDAAQMGVSPEHSLYVCADQWIAVAALEPRERDAFRKLCGDRAEAYFRERPAAEALAALAEAGVPAEQVQRDAMEAYFEDPAIRAVGMVATYPRSAWGRLEQIGAMWDLGDLPLTFEYPAPRIGEHSCAFLEAVGLPRAEIDALLTQGLLAQDPSGAPARLEAAAG
jgi:crotonobetainyl-CoA:carnitine CoA-transferase CaiB-like acyl-CoA transferase